MQSEIEVKFIDVDIADMRKRLEAAGAVCVHPMRLMRRALIEEPAHAADNSFIRIRDEGDKVTLTFKHRDEAVPTKIDSVKEIEVEVSDFDKTVELFSAAGWHYKTFQESKRETWNLDDAEIVIDEWPWIPPYIEIEAETEEAVRTATEKLGFSWENAEYGHIDTIYSRHYTFVDGIRGVIDIPEVRFADPVPLGFQS